jgi:hypothetical protein
MARCDRGRHWPSGPRTQGAAFAGSKGKPRTPGPAVCQRRNPGGPGRGLNLLNLGASSSPAAVAPPPATAASTRFPRLRRRRMGVEGSGHPGLISPWQWPQDGGGKGRSAAILRGPPLNFLSSCPGYPHLPFRGAGFTPERPGLRLASEKQARRGRREGEWQRHWSDGGHSRATLCSREPGSEPTERIPPPALSLAGGRCDGEEATRGHPPRVASELLRRDPGRESDLDQILIAGARTEKLDRQERSRPRSESLAAAAPTSSTPSAPSVARRHPTAPWCDVGRGAPSVRAHGPTASR